jgi:hypothetical protein
VLFASGVGLTLAVAAVLWATSTSTEVEVPLAKPFAPVAKPRSPTLPPARAPEPDPVVAAPPVEPPAAPLPQSAPAGLPYTWSCKKITDITPIYDSSYAGVWQAFQITVAEASPLTVVIQAPNLKKSELKKFRAAISACRTSARNVGASKGKPFTSLGWPMDNGIWLKGGMWAYLDDVKLF